MRRPATLICGAYIFGMAVEIVLNVNSIIILIFAVVVLSAMIISMKFYKKNRFKCDYKRLCLFFVVFILIVLGALHYNYESNKTTILEMYEGEYLQIQGKVISIIEKEKEKYKMIIEVHNLEGVGNFKNKEKLLVNIYGKVSNYYTLPGKIIKIQGFIELPTTRRNPKTFDYRLYLRTKKISTTMSIRPENIQDCNNINSYYLNYLYKIKYIFKCNLNSLFDEKISALLMGMIFGDNSGLSQELYDTFQKNGICHILAVSGLHIGAIYICINSVLGGKRKLKFYVVTILILFLYASLVNFSSSVMRAVLMILFHIISKYMYCKYDMFTSAMMTMALMLFFNPMSLMNLGFQLSYVAIFTLAVVLPAIQRIYNKKIITIFVIQLGMSPISAFAFNYFSFSAFITNVPVVFIAGILIPLGMILLLFSIITMILPNWYYFNAVFDFLFQIIGISVEFFSKLLLYINDLAFIDKISYKYVTSPSIGVIFLYYSTLFFVFSEYFRILWQRHNYKKIITIITIIFFISFIFGNLLNDGFENTQFTFVDVGQGDCLLIKTSDGKNVLIDSGGSSQFDVGKKILLPYLLKNGIKKIDMAIISHLHTDHLGGLCSLTHELPVRKVGIYEANSLISDEVSEQIGIAKKDFIYLTKGQILKIGKELEIEILYPEKKSVEEYSKIMKNQKDENAACLVMKIKLKGISVLMNGDIGFEAENFLLAYNKKESLDIDILKVAHHGSKYGSSDNFLQVATPKIAVVQVGKNTYGHPNMETLHRIEAVGALVYRNDLHGAVGIEIEKSGVIKIHTMI